MMFAVAEADDHAVVTAGCAARHVEATYGLKVNALWNRCLILVREGVDVPAAGQLLEKARAGICNPRTSGRQWRHERDPLAAAVRARRLPSELFVHLGGPLGDSRPPMALVELDRSKPSTQWFVSQSARERRTDCINVSRIEERLLIAEKLGEGRGVRADHRSAARDRLGHRQSEPFVQRGEDEQLTRLIEANELFVRNVTWEMDTSGDPQLAQPPAQRRKLGRQHLANDHELVALHECVR